MEKACLVVLTSVYVPARALRTAFSLEGTVAFGRLLGRAETSEAQAMSFAGTWVKSIVDLGFDESSCYEFALSMATTKGSFEK
jgi:hypothetical protein